MRFASLFELLQEFSDEKNVLRILHNYALSMEHFVRIVKAKEKYIIFQMVSVINVQIVESSLLYA